MDILWLLFVLGSILFLAYYFLSGEGFLTSAEGWLYFVASRAHINEGENVELLIQKIESGEIKYNIDPLPSIDLMRYLAMNDNPVIDIESLTAPDVARDSKVPLYRLVGYVKQGKFAIAGVYQRQLDHVLLDYLMQKRDLKELKVQLGKLNDEAWLYRINN